MNDPLVMGILNVTPDSFFDGGSHISESGIANKLQQMVSEGVDIIDIGGYSSRPGAKEISVNQELDRILPAVIKAREINQDIPISIDTFRSNVALAALDAGADMINDISGGDLDPHMFKLVAERQVPYIIMHMRGNPQNMTDQTDYHDLLPDIMQYFVEKVALLSELGVNDVIIDPGFGFAKTMKQNYELLANLSFLQEVGLPLLVGLSRKSMIYKALNILPDEALAGTIAANTMALMNGASILRVHDVREAIQTIKLFKEAYH